MLGKTLLHEFRISSSDTEWNGNGTCSLPSAKTAIRSGSRVLLINLFALEFYNIFEHFFLLPAEASCARRDSEPVAVSLRCRPSNPSLDTTLSFVSIRNVPRGWGRLSWFEPPAQQSNRAHCHPCDLSTDGKSPHNGKLSNKCDVGAALRRAGQGGTCGANPPALRTTRGSLRSLHRELLDSRSQHLSKECISGLDKCDRSCSDPFVPLQKSTSNADLPSNRGSPPYSPGTCRKERTFIKQTESPPLPPRNALNLGFELDRPLKSNKQIRVIPQQYKNSSNKDFVDNETANIVRSAEYFANGAPDCSKSSNSDEYLRKLINLRKTDSTEEKISFASKKRLSSEGPELPSRNPPLSQSLRLPKLHNTPGGLDESDYLAVPSCSDSSGGSDLSLCSQIDSSRVKNAVSFAPEQTYNRCEDKVRRGGTVKSRTSLAGVVSTITFNHNNKNKVKNSESYNDTSGISINESKCNRPTEADVKKRKSSTSFELTKLKKSLKNSLFRKRSKSDDNPEISSAATVDVSKHSNYADQLDAAIRNSGPLHNNISQCAFTDFSEFETKCISNSVSESQCNNNVKSLLKSLPEASLTLCSSEANKSLLPTESSSSIASDEFRTGRLSTSATGTSRSISVKSYSSDVFDGAHHSPSVTYASFPDTNFELAGITRPICCDKVPRDPQQDDICVENCVDGVGKNINQTVKVFDTEHNLSCLSAPDVYENSVVTLDSSTSENCGISDTPSTTVSRDALAAAAMSHHGGSANYGTLRRGIKATTSRIIGASIRRPGMSPAISLGKPRHISSHHLR